jgi:hypothetical protein
MTRTLKGCQIAFRRGGCGSRSEPRLMREQTLFRREGHIANTLQERGNLRPLRTPPWVTRIAKPPRHAVERLVLGCVNRFVPLFHSWVHPAGMSDHSRGSASAPWERLPQRGNLIQPRANAQHAALGYQTKKTICSPEGAAESP